MATYSMSNHNLFHRYSKVKMQKFQSWLQTPHGRQVYKLFRQFAGAWRDAGHDKCGASLIVNRLRWETGIDGRYQGFKISNDHGPMLARQLATDDPSYAPFFTFHRDKEDHAATDGLHLTPVG